MNGETVFQIGVAVAVAALAVGIISAVALRVGWKRLSAKLDVEYGPKKRYGTTSVSFRNGGIIFTVSTS